jgi:hypothetical protein
MSENEQKRAGLWLSDGLASQDVSLLSAFHYSENAEKALHCNAHVDKGLVSIVLNPTGLEVLVDGKWVCVDKTAFGEPLPECCAVVLAGHTLEMATAGLCKAALHRVRNTGAARTSIVAKIRADRDTVLDMPWATRCVADTSAHRARHGSGSSGGSGGSNGSSSGSSSSGSSSGSGMEQLRSVTVAELLHDFEAEHLGVNRSSGCSLEVQSRKPLLTSPAQQPHPNQETPKRPKLTNDFGASTVGGPFAKLTPTCMNRFGIFLGVISLGRMSCTCKGGYTFGTSEQFWVNAAVHVDMALPTSVLTTKLHVVLGERLAVYDRNTEIELLLTDDCDVAFSDCQISRAELGSEIQNCSGATVQKVRIDQRTPLRTITKSFEEHLQGRPDKECGPGNWRGGYQVCHGVPIKRDFDLEYYNMPVEQNIDTGLTAWHWQLVNGDVLTFVNMRPPILAD